MSNNYIFAITNGFSEILTYGKTIKKVNMFNSVNLTHYSDHKIHTIGSTDSQKPAYHSGKRVGFKIKLT